VVGGQLEQNTTRSAVLYHRCGFDDGSSIRVLLHGECRMAVQMRSVNAVRSAPWKSVMMPGASCSGYFGVADDTFRVRPRSMCWTRVSAGCGERVHPWVDATQVVGFMRVEITGVTRPMKRPWRCPRVCVFQIWFGKSQEE